MPPGAPRNEPPSALNRRSYPVIVGIATVRRPAVTDGHRCAKVSTYRSRGAKDKDAGGSPVPQRTKSRKTPQPDDLILYADVAEVASWAATLPESFLTCRDIGHRWRKWAAKQATDFPGYIRELRCTRCKTKRRQELNANFHILSSTYQHAEGYLHKGLGRVDGDGRDALRGESMMRDMGATSDGGGR